MFESIDPDRDRFVDLTASNASAQASGKNTRASMIAAQASEASMVVLEAGFRARVMSWRSAYDLGARSGLSLEALRARTEQCARFIHAGLGCAVDETLFAALVYHYPDISKDLSRISR